MSADIGIKTLQHYELLEAFERQFSHRRLTRESKDLWTKGVIYQDGLTNDLFLAFRMGYALGIAVNREEHEWHP